MQAVGGRAARRRKRSVPQNSNRGVYRGVCRREQHHPLDLSGTVPPRCRKPAAASKGCVLARACSRLWRGGALSLGRQQMQNSKDLHTHFLSAVPSTQNPLGFFFGGGRWHGDCMHKPPLCHSEPCRSVRCSSLGLAAFSSDHRSFVEGGGLAIKFHTLVAAAAAVFTSIID